MYHGRSIPLSRASRCHQERACPVRSATSMARAGVARAGLAVPISRPRYTWRASAEMTVIGVRDASATATAVLPTPVGPTMTGVRCRVSGAAKTPFQLFLWQLDHRGPAMHVVRGECGRKQPDDELAHLVGLECLARLDRGAAGVGGGKPLESILPAAN